MGEEVLKRIKRSAEIVAKKMGFSLEAVILFGLRARGDHNEKSDYDILVVLKDTFTRKEKFEFVRMFREMTDDISLDVIVKSSGELEEYRDFYGTVTHKALKERLRIH